jgi:SAM-dependent methyltransferase
MYFPLHHQAKALASNSLPHKETTMKCVSSTGFNSILHSVEIIKDGKPVELDAETKVNLDFHSDRFFQTYKFLLPFLNANTSVLDVGLCPYFATSLQHITKCSITGVCGGHRIDNIKDEKKQTTITTRHAGADYSIPMYDGYDFETDKLPFNDNSFDVVLLLEIIEHFIIDPVFSLKEIARVLKPNGVLILTTDNSHRFINFVKLLSLKPIYWPYNDKMYGERHNREYMKTEIQLLLNGMGFKDTDVQLRNLSPFSSGNSPLKKKLGYAFSNFITSMPYFSNFKRHIFACARKDRIIDFYPGWLFMRREGWLENQTK